MMRIEEIKNIIDRLEYGYYGIRVEHSKEYQVGDICDKSLMVFQDDPELDGVEYDSESGYWVGDELSGTACVRIYNSLLVEECDINKAISYAKRHYFGDKVLLIAGDYAENGIEPNEIDIENAKVLAIIDKKSDGIYWDSERE